MSIMPTDFRAIEARLPQAEPWRLELLKAAERIAVRGHAKEIACAEDGSVCALGAIWDAAPNLHFNNFTKAGEKARQKLRERVGQIDLWNDHPSRTAQEVITTMIEVALAP